MDAPGGMSKIDPQEHIAPNVNVKDPANTDQHGDHETSTSANEHNDLKASDGDCDDDNKQEFMELPAKSEIRTAQDVHADELESSDREGSAKMDEPTSPEDLNHFPEPVTAKTEVKEEQVVIKQEDGETVLVSDEDAHPSMHVAEDPAETEVVVESIRSNPYAFAAGLAAPNQSTRQDDVGLDEPHATSNQPVELGMTAEHIDTPVMNEHQDEESQDGSGCEESCVENGTAHAQVRDEHPDQNEEDVDDEDDDDEEMQYTQNDCSDDSGSEEDDEEADDASIARLQSQLRADMARVKPSSRNQHEQLTQDNMKRLNLTQEENHSRAEQHAARQHFNHKDSGAAGHLQLDPKEWDIEGLERQFHPPSPPSQRRFNFSPGNEPQMLGFYRPRHEPGGMHSFLSHDPSLTPFNMPEPPYMSRGTLQNIQPHSVLGQYTMGYPQMGFAMQAHGQQPPISGFAPYSTSAHNLPAQSFVPAPLNGYRSRGQTGPNRVIAHQHRPQEDQALEDNETDDDEPLRTRVPRHPSVLSDHIMTGSPHRGADAQYDEHDCGSDGDREYFRALEKTNKLSTATKKGKETAPKQGPTDPPVQSPTSAKVPSESGPANIDWKLPEYDAQFEPGKTKDDPTVAKISIPGLIREEVLLSPDHAEQETHLFMTVFMPGQEALAVPDPAPAQAILNFHTIAVMVIEAYVQYEIGDEYGKGRGHWHSDHDQDDTEYQRVREAKDADPDDIFFAVIDRWRAGLECNKQSAKLIRGAQELCDTALELVYYIKEHGLLKPKPKPRQRAARSDKGVKRGARKVEEQIKASPKGVKRGAEKVNTLQTRKKAKVSEKATQKTKPKPRGRPKKQGPTVTVVKAPAKKK